MAVPVALSPDEGPPPEPPREAARGRSPLRGAAGAAASILAGPFGRSRALAGPAIPDEGLGAAGAVAPVRARAPRSSSPMPATRLPGSDLADFDAEDDGAEAARRWFDAGLATTTAPTTPAASAACPAASSSSRPPSPPQQRQLGRPRPPSAPPEPALSPPQSPPAPGRRLLDASGFPLSPPESLCGKAAALRGDAAAVAAAADQEAGSLGSMDSTAAGSSEACTTRAAPADLPLYPGVPPQPAVGSSGPSLTPPLPLPVGAGKWLQPPAGLRLNLDTGQAPAASSCEAPSRLLQTGAASGSHPPGSSCLGDTTSEWSSRNAGAPAPLPLASMIGFASRPQHQRDVSPEPLLRGNAPLSPCGRPRPMGVHGSPTSMRATIGAVGGNRQLAYPQSPMRDRSPSADTREAFSRSIAAPSSPARVARDGLRPLSPAASRSPLVGTRSRDVSPMSRSPLAESRIRRLSPAPRSSLVQMQAGNQRSLVPLSPFAETRTLVRHGSPMARSPAPEARVSLVSRGTPQQSPARQRGAILHGATITRSPLAETRNAYSPLGRSISLPMPAAGVYAPAVPSSASATTYVSQVWGTPLNPIMPAGLQASRYIPAGRSATPLRARSPSGDASFLQDGVSRQPSHAGAALAAAIAAALPAAGSSAPIAASSPRPQSPGGRMPPRYSIGGFLSPVTGNREPLAGESPWLPSRSMDGYPGGFGGYPASRSCSPRPSSPERQLRAPTAAPRNAYVWDPPMSCCGGAGTAPPTPAVALNDGPPHRAGSPVGSPVRRYAGAESPPRAGVSGALSGGVNSSAWAAPPDMRAASAFLSGARRARGLEL
eukprot:TRINITY_DN11465_c0_g4_i2.p1 TRINITY_DN11465_c0_g4~~TRINITY_DN11465_c0_g4_i2.p1  ORF type:complete len:844 (+),score=86.47 TRINITY_DN11465_c0_g4_i2:50-2533(+)